MGIRIKELRIGNFIIGVVWGDENPQQELLCKFLGYNPWDDFIWVDSNSSTERFEEFKPIPLTEDWLLKFGVVKNGDLFAFSRFVLRWREEYKYWYVLSKEDITYMTKIEFVHEWQNFIYVMEGQELTLK